MEDAFYKCDDPFFIAFLARMNFLSTEEKMRLYNLFGDVEGLSKLSIEDIGAIFHRTFRAKFDGKENYEKTKREVAIMEGKGVNFIFNTSPEYPKKLKKIPSPPFVLFYKGNIAALNAKKSLSVVGTRHITPQVTRATEAFVRAAAADGVTIVSGLANGVDGVAHKAVIDAYFDALEAGLKVDKNSGEAKTVACLPCCVNTATPSNHAKLAEDIVSIGGCLISEVTPLMKIEKWSFAVRNRVIAALTPATFVMQAPNGSGALITAQFAQEYGRSLFFHAAAFGEMEKQVEAAIRDRLQHDFACGLVSKSKLENCCKKYIDSGAVVVDSYKNYLKYLEAFPQEIAD